MIPKELKAPKAETQDLQRTRRIAELSNDMDVKFFPHLFPTGEGGWKEEYGSFSQYARKRLLGADPRFEASPGYIMWLLEMHLKKRLSGNVNVRIGGQQVSSRRDGKGQVFAALRNQLVRLRKERCRHQYVRAAWHAQLLHDTLLQRPAARHSHRRHHGTAVAAPAGKSARRGRAPSRADPAQLPVRQKLHLGRSVAEPALQSAPGSCGATVHAPGDPADVLALCRARSQEPPRRRRGCGGRACQRNAWRGGRLCSGTSYGCGRQTPTSLQGAATLQGARLHHPHRVAKEGLPACSHPALDGGDCYRQ